MAFGGDPTTADTETWNGSNWTEVNNLNDSRDALGGAGTNTSALAFGGNSPGTSNGTELWNGTNWTSVNNLNAARKRIAGAGASNTACLAFGGKSSGGPDPEVGNTEVWNGTNWTEVGDMSVVRGYLGGAGVNTNALGFGGSSPLSPTAPTATEEFSSGPATVTFGTS